MPKVHHIAGWGGAVLLLFLATTAGSQPSNVTFEPIPDWVRPVVWTPSAAPAPADSSESTRCLLLEDQKWPQQKEHFVRVISRMENATGVQDSGSLTFDFNPTYQTIAIHRVQIHRAGQTLDRLDKTRIKLIQSEPDLNQDLFTGDQTVVLFVEDLRVGDELEYAYTVRGANPALGDHFSTSLLTQYGQAVDRQRLRVLWTSPAPLHIQIHRSQTSAVESPVPGGREYLWDFGPLPALKTEDELPITYEPYPYVEFSDYSDWAEVVHWALPLYATADTNMPVELHDLIAKWQAGSSSDEEKARRALQFVQDDLRYTGLELGPDSYRPAEPFETFRKRFGDCKGKVQLYCAILRAMNVEACPALVNTTSRETIDGRLPSPFSFNHVIARLTLAGRTVWVDPTWSYQGGSLWNRYVLPLGKALVVRSGVSSLEDLPPRPAGIDRQLVTSTFNIKDYVSPTEFSVTTKYYGSEADDIRQQAARSDSKEFSKNYLNFYSRKYPGIEVAKPLAFGDDREKNVFVVTENYRIKNLWKRDEESGRLQMFFDADGLKNALPNPSSRLRTMPMYIPFPLEREQDVIVHLPEAWDIPDLKTSIVNHAFALEYERKESASLLHLHFKLKTSLKEIPPQDTPAYLAQLDDFDTFTSRSLLRPEPGNQPAIDRLNWLMVVLAIFGAAVTTAACLWAWRATRRPEPLPSTGSPLVGLSGWLILVAIGLCLGPVLKLNGLLQHWHGFFSLTVWQAIATPGGSSYHPLYGPLIMFELLGNEAFLGLNILVLCFFFSKRRVFPRFYIALLLFMVVFEMIDHFGCQLIPSIAAVTAAKGDAKLAQFILTAAIWISYTLKSERVKATFLK